MVVTEKLVSGKTALVSIFDIHSLRTFFIESDDFHDYFTEGQSFFCQAEVRWRIQLVLKRLEERGNKEDWSRLSVKSIIELALQ